MVSQGLAASVTRMTVHPRSPVEMELWPREMAERPRQPGSCCQQCADGLHMREMSGRDSLSLSAEDLLPGQI